jgi:hypothetical protein
MFAMPKKEFPGRARRKQLLEKLREQYKDPV